MSDLPPSLPESTPPSAAPPPPPPPPPVHTDHSIPPPGVGGVYAPGTVAVGTLGKPRSAALVILLTIVTFGIWAVVWSYQNGDELKRHSGNGLGGVAYLFITLLISPVTMFLMASEVEQLYRREGKEPPITTIWGLWFLLPIVGQFIWFLRIQKSINEYWVGHGSAAASGL